MTVRSTSIALSLACPRCHGLVSTSTDMLVCAACGAQFPLVDGIPCFAEDDTFYEGKWALPDLSAGSLRNRMVKKERFFLSQLRGQQGSILDLGCGGGWRLFSLVGHAVGVDVSLGSLRGARQLYDQVAQARLSHLPFPDESFDYVVSSDVLGHIPLEEKDGVLKEIHRVLKHGGQTLHYVEAEGNDPFMCFARKWPELYERYVVEPEGHIGLEAAPAIASRFAQAGFSTVINEPCYRGLTYAKRYVQYFDNEYSRKSLLIKGVVAVCKLTTIASPLELLSNVGMTLLIELGDIMLPANWAGGLLISCEKV